MESGDKMLRWGSGNKQGWGVTQHLAISDIQTAFAFHEPDGVIDAHTVSKIPALLSQLLLSWYTILV